MTKWLLMMVSGMCGVAACSSSTADKYPNVDSFCQAVAQEQCQEAASCGNTMSACLTARKSKCAADASATGRPYNAGNAQSCIDKNHTIYAQVTVTPQNQADLQAVCDKVFAGSLNALQHCTATQDCSGSLICDKGVCANQVTKNLGDFCGNPGEICGGDSFCAASAAATQCVAKKGSGDTCAPTTAPCQGTLRCSGTCQPRQESGNACSSNDDCAPDAPYCDPDIGGKCDKGQGFTPGSAACKSTAWGGSG